MKRIAFFFILTLALAACGTSSGHFKVEGRFLNLSQGEFYVYSTDGTVNGIDTIKIDGGRFAYEIPCKQEGTLMLVFPNFSEQPIFAEPGKSVDIKADASHLKEMEVKGTEANELMTRFRKQISSVSPPEAVKAAEAFISGNPESPVGVYLLRKYFIQASTPDYDKAEKLVAVMLRKQDRNGLLIKMQHDIEVLKSSVAGSNIPKFSAYDINGRSVSNADISGRLAVILTWASWNYESQDMLRQINKTMKNSGGRLKAISISLDAGKRDCQNAMKRDSITLPTICDGQIFESPVLKKLGLCSVPDNIIVGSDGKIIARGLNKNELKEQLGKKLGIKAD